MAFGSSDVAKTRSETFRNYATGTAALLAAIASLVGAYAGKEAASSYGRAVSEGVTVQAGGPAAIAESLN